MPVPASAIRAPRVAIAARDGRGHRQLLRAVTEARERPGQRAAVAEDRGEVGVVRAGRGRVGRGRAGAFRGRRRSRVARAGQFDALRAAGASAVFVLAAGFALVDAGSAVAALAPLAMAVRTTSARSLKY